MQRKRQDKGKFGSLSFYIKVLQPIQEMNSIFFFEFYFFSSHFLTNPQSSYYSFCLLLYVCTHTCIQLYLCIIQGKRIILMQHQREKHKLHETDSHLFTKKHMAISTERESNLGGNVGTTFFQSKNGYFVFEHWNVIDNVVINF